MRLINTSTLQLEEFFDASVPEYAILSHTWEKEEIIFPDMADLDKARSKVGFAKMEGACALAAAQGHDYIWIDTCCIDKSSSAELSEAINSMYRWYQLSQVCYAYLCDVKDATEIGDSRWFTRGWTLQELIAPSLVEFYTADWVHLGEKQDPDLVLALSRASLVDECVLGRIVGLEDVSVAKKFYWASKRNTTRREDEAYCLMGLFNVNMPLMYGEGVRAFFRLQQEITKVTHDQSILAWYYDPFYGEPDPEISRGYSGCYAKSPKCFALSGDITPLPVAQEGGLGEIDFTNPLRSSFSAILGETESGGLEVILCCQIGPVPGTCPTLGLSRDGWSRNSYKRYLQDGVVSQTSMYTPEALLAEASTSPTTNTPHQITSFGLWVGQPTPGEAGAAEVRGLGGNETLSFPVEYITIRDTLVSHGDADDRAPSIDGDENELPSNEYYAPKVFWLLPLVKEGSGASISVLDVFPANFWNHGTHQFTWAADALPESHPPVTWEWEVPFATGAARINFNLGNREPGSGADSHGTAIMVFGLVRAETDPQARTALQSWCYLVGDDGRSDLEQHYFTPKVASQGAKSRASLTIGTGITLNASTNTADISGRECELMNLWITGLPTDGDVVAPRKSEKPWRRWKRGLRKQKA